MADSTINNSHEGVYLGCIIAFQVLAVLVIIIRFFSKLKIVGSFGPDDWLMGTALIVYCVFTITSCLYVHIARLGHPASEISLTADDRVNAMQLLLATQLLYNPVLAFSKASIILFYRRITLDQTFHRYCSITLGVVVAHAIAVFFGNLFQCVPVSTLFHHVQPGKCIDMGTFLLVTGALSMLMDTWIILMPQRVILNLHLPLKKRLMLMSLFAFGIVLVAVAIVRLISIRQIDWHSTSPQSSYGNAIIWSPIEASIALICASVPSFRPLFTKWFPAFFHTSFEFDFRHNNNVGMDEFGNRKEGNAGFKAKILALGGNHWNNEPNPHMEEAVIKVQKTVVIEEIDHGLKTTNEIEISHHVLERRDTAHSGRRSSGSGSATVIGDDEECALGLQGSPPGLDGLHLHDDEDDLKKHRVIARPRYL